MEYKLERLLRAAELEKLGDWENMLAFCIEWVELEPLNCIAWQGIGDSYRKLARPEDAVAAYKKGLEVAPSKPIEMLGRTLSSAAIWYQLGHAFCDLGLLDMATEAFKESIRVEPDKAYCWNDLGVVYRAQDNNDGAFNAFKKAVTLDPTDINSLKNLESMYELSGSQEGVTFVRQKLLQITGHSPPAQKHVKPEVDRGVFKPAPSEEVQQEKMRLNLKRKEIERKAKVRDIDVASTLEEILLILSRGESLPNAVHSVSWIWSSEERAAFMTDIEQEKARGTIEADAIRAALTRFSTR